MLNWTSQKGWEGEESSNKKNILVYIESLRIQQPLITHNMGRCARETSSLARNDPQWLTMKGSCIRRLLCRGYGYFLE